MFNWQKWKQINPCWILIFCPCFCILTWLYLTNVINMCCIGLNDPFPAPCCLYSLSRSTVSGLTYLSSRRYSEAKFCILNTFFPCFLIGRVQKLNLCSDMYSTVYRGKLGYPTQCQGKIWKWIGSAKFSASPKMMLALILYLIHKMKHI